MKKIFLALVIITATVIGLLIIGSKLIELNTTNVSKPYHNSSKTSNFEISISQDESLVSKKRTWDISIQIPESATSEKVHREWGEDDLVIRGNTFQLTLSGTQEGGRTTYEHSTEKEITNNNLNQKIYRVASNTPNTWFYTTEYSEGEAACGQGGSACGISQIREFELTAFCQVKDASNSDGVNACDSIMESLVAKYY